MQEKLTRFKDASWLGNQESCIIGGAGGIGSWLTLMLARANFAPVVYDFDTLEPHNFGGQLFAFSEVNKSKVDALSKMVKQFADVDISTLEEKYTLESMTGYYVFSAFDNMKARKDMFTLWARYVDSVPDVDKYRCVFIDGRLMAEQIQIFCIVGDRRTDMVTYYKDHLFGDDEVPDGPCTMKQTSHAAAIIAGLMTGFFTNHIHNVRVGAVQRSVPFFHEYYIPINLTT